MPVFGVLVCSLKRETVVAEPLLINKNSKIIRILNNVEKSIMRTVDKVGTMEKQLLRIPFNVYYGRFPVSKSKNMNAQHRGLF